MAQRKAALPSQAQSQLTRENSFKQHSSSLLSPPPPPPTSNLLQQNQPQSHHPHLSAAVIIIPTKDNNNNNVNNQHSQFLIGGEFEQLQQYPFTSISDGKTATDKLDKQHHQLQQQQQQQQQYQQQQQQQLQQHSVLVTGILPQKQIAPRAHSAHAQSSQRQPNHQIDDSTNSKSTYQKHNQHIAPAATAASADILRSTSFHHHHQQSHSPRRSANEFQTSTPQPNHHQRAISLNSGSDHQSSHLISKSNPVNKQQQQQVQQSRENNHLNNSNLNQGYIQDAIAGEYETEIHIQSQHLRSNHRRPNSKQQPDPKATFENLKELIKQQQLDFKKYQSSSNFFPKLSDQIDDTQHHQQQQNSQNIYKPANSPRDFIHNSASKHAKQQQSAPLNTQQSQSQYMHSHQQLSTSHETAKPFDDRTCTLPSWPSQPSQHLLHNHSKIFPQQSFIMKDDEKKQQHLLDTIAVPSSFQTIYGGVLKSNFNATHPTGNQRQASSSSNNRSQSRNNNNNNSNNNNNNSKNSITNNNKTNDSHAPLALSYESAPLSKIKAGTNHPRRKKLSIISDIQFEDLFANTPQDLQLCPKRINNHSKHPFEPDNVLPGKDKRRKQHIRSHSESTNRNTYFDPNLARNKVTAAELLF